jgi:hypothetical protein
VRQAAMKKARERSVVVRQQLARQSYADLLPQMREMRATGLSLAAIAATLTDAGHTTRRGRPWNPVQVLLVLRRGSSRPSP